MTTPPDWASARPGIGHPGHVRHRRVRGRDQPARGAILAVGQVRREPVVKGDAGVPGRRMAMTLSCDHRVVDGAVGATFLKVLRQLPEHPTQILIL